MIQGMVSYGRDSSQRLCRPAPSEVDQPHLTLKHKNKRVRGDRSKNDTILYYYSRTSRAKPSWFDKELRNWSRAPPYVSISVLQECYYLHVYSPYESPAHTMSNKFLLLYLSSSAPGPYLASQEFFGNHSASCFMTLKPYAARLVSSP